MADVIKFKKPNVEDKFMESLNEYQLELFGEVMELIEQDYLTLAEENFKLTQSLAKKCAENELLKMKIKGEKL